MTDKEKFDEVYKRIRNSGYECHDDFDGKICAYFADNDNRLEIVDDGNDSDIYYRFGLNVGLNGFESFCREDFHILYNRCSDKFSKLFEGIEPPEEKESFSITLDDDSLNIPDHYKVNDVDTMEVISQVLKVWEAERSEAFYLGNVIKYIMRAPFKNDFGGDIDKAIDYLKRLKRMRK